MSHLTQAIYSELQEALISHPILNTHSHLLPDRKQTPFSLDKLFEYSYVGVEWIGVPWDETAESRRHFLEQVHFHSAYTWLRKSLQELYQLDAPITAENWDEVSAVIAQAHQNPGYHLSILKDRCAYRKIILDAYWDPGSDNGHPELIAPTFRVEAFFFGYSPDVIDADGNNFLALYQRQPFDNLDNYLAFLREKVAEKKAQGCIAIKVPIAYDRGLDFFETQREKAVVAFQNLRDEINPEDVKIFQDFLFFEICQLAAEYNLPLQIHTGTGQGQRTNALWLQEAIVKNPETRFVLFHCSYPWIGDTNILVRKYRNVFADLCMLPLFSSGASRQILHELIEGATADRIFWGCDTWTPEESYGSLLALRHVLSTVLAEKVTEGYFSTRDAACIIENVLYNNAAAFYRFDAPVTPAR